MSARMDRERAVALRAAREAAARVVELNTADVEVRYKAADDPVTAADEASTRVILDHLGRELPGDAVLIEERADDRSRLGADRVWIVDPLDGTREFIDRVPEFCVMLGLVEGGVPVLGVVWIPLTSTAYVGVRGEGARRIDADGSETALSLRPAPDIERMRLVVSRSHRSASITRAMELLGITEEVPSGSVGVKVSRILEGRADLYIHLGPGIKLWDACAPEAILRAAGGAMTDPAGAPIDYTAESVHCGLGLLASDGTHHEELVRRLAPVLDELRRRAATTR
jgi:3'(2'), 5'-bisphosphate nucleotidase